MRDIDDNEPGWQDVLKLLYAGARRARVIGLTGSPGVGKSTITDALVERFRAKGLTVGVVAVDPTSPFFRRGHIGRPYPHAAPRHR